MPGSHAGARRARSAPCSTGPGCLAATTRRAVHAAVRTEGQAAIQARRKSRARANSQPARASRERLATGRLLDVGHVCYTSRVADAAPPGYFGPYGGRFVAETLV